MHTARLLHIGVEHSYFSCSSNDFGFPQFIYQPENRSGFLSLASFQCLLWYVGLDWLYTYYFVTSPTSSIGLCVKQTIVQLYVLYVLYFIKNTKTLVLSQS